MSRHPLAREVAFVLAVKLMIILAAALFVFNPGRRPRIDAAAVQARFIGGLSAAQQPGNVIP